jgi:autotransporter-associated beta strand protein
MNPRCAIRRLAFALLFAIGGIRCWAVPSFTTAISQGNIQNSSVSEASGIVASRANPNVLWTNNDSGDSARLYPMTTAGRNLGTYSISGAGAADWEDIAVGPGPVDGQQYLYAADIGDNGASRSSVSIYRIPEPVVSDLQSATNVSVSGAVRLTFVYPDGPRDAESMFVDPATRDIYIVSKRESSNRVYRAAYPQATSGAITLQFMTSLPGLTWTTAADLSPDGSEILLRSTGSSSGRLFVRPPGGSITDAFNTSPITVPLASEPQGEAIGFDPTGRGYFTTSEGSSQPVYYFNRTSPAGAMYWDNDGLAAGSYTASGVGLGGTGTWNSTARKWYSGGAEVPWVSGDDAVFWGTAGTVTLASPQNVNSLAFKTNGYDLTSSTLTLAGASITVDAGLTANISSTLAGSVGLTKNGTGSLILTNGNTYFGTTTVAAGTLDLANTTGSATGAGPVVVNPGAVLGGSGTALGDVTNSGTVSPGTSSGTLHIGGSYSQDGSGLLEVEIADLLNFDKLEVAGSASLAGTLSVLLTPSFVPQAGNAFEILTSSGLDGSVFSTASLPALADGLAWNINYDATAVTLSVDLAGDFDRSGTVDAGDYVWWRNFDGTPGGYETWQANFGRTIGSGAGAAAALPEAASWILAVVGVVAAVVGQRRVRIS